MRFVRGITIAVFIGAVILWGVGKIYTLKQDKQAPVIQSENDEIHVQAGCDESEFMKGLTATDNVDGDLTKEIIVGSISPFIEKGVSTIEYLVFDQSNNVGRYERTVYFDDYRSPKLVLTEPLMYKQNTEIVLSDRLFAIDSLDGDISSKIRLSTPGVSQSETGIYEINVEVKNSYGDLVKESLLLNIIPYQNDQGHIKLKEYLIYVSKDTEIFPMTYIDKVVDSDGHVLSEEDVSVSMEVDMSKTGTGQIRYELTDPYGNRAVTYMAVIVTE